MLRTTNLARMIAPLRAPVRGMALMRTVMPARSAAQAPSLLARSLHVSRATFADAPDSKPSSEKNTVGGSISESEAFKKISRNNVHVLESATLNTWLEIPKGGYHGADRTKAIWSIWYNHAVVPLYVVCVVAASLCGWFMYRCVCVYTHAELTRLDA